MYTKPYIFWPYYKSDRHILYFKWKEIKTNSLIFAYGQKLPFDTGKDHMAFTKQDPKDYDLVFHAKVLPRIFCQYDHLRSNGPGIVLINQKIKTILMELCPDDVQFFKAVIVPFDPHKMDFENHDYWVMNITKTVDAFDAQESIFKEVYPGRITDVDKIILKEQSNEKFIIARQFNYTLTILLSSSLVTRFEKEHVTGIRFLKDYEYGRHTLL